MMIIGPAGFMHAPKSNLPPPPPYKLEELYIGQQLVICVGKDDYLTVQVTKVVMEPNTIHGFNWKATKGRRSGWAYVDQIV
jgi:hypothetical protein